VPGFTDFYFQEVHHYEPEAARKDFVPENQPRLKRLRDALAELDRFDAETLQATLKSVAKELGVKAGVLVHPTRLACTGKAIGPSLYHLLELLGRERVLQRLDRAIGRMEG
jgi:glutamyl-tRNA synthetase